VLLEAEHPIETDTLLLAELEVSLLNLLPGQEYLLPLMREARSMGR